MDFLSQSLTKTYHVGVPNQNRYNDLTSSTRNGYIVHSYAMCDIDNMQNIKKIDKNCEYNKNHVMNEGNRQFVYHTFLNVGIII